MDREPLGLQVLGDGRAGLVDVDRELDAATESVFLDWAIPWMLDNEARFCFAEPNDEESPGFYGLRD